MKNNRIDELLELHRTRKAAIRRRLKDFSRIPSSGYFYELLYCILTPQTSAGNADLAVGELKQSLFAEIEIDPEPILADRSHYIRFHKTKAKHLVRIKHEMPEILRTLSNDGTSLELREWLVKNVKGLGYKEATHFLRNVGRNNGLAILDRHILRNLKRFGAIRSLPKSLSRKQYFSIERKFKRFSEKVRIPVDELDLLFWSMETGEIRK